MQFNYDQCRSFFYILRIMEYLDRQQKNYYADVVCWAQRIDLEKDLPHKSLSAREERRYCAQIRKKIESYIKQAEQMSTSVLWQNISFASRLFNLTEAETQILEAVLLWRKKTYLRVFARVVFREDLDSETLSAFAGISEDEVLALLKSNAPLMRYGFLEMRRFTSEYDVGEEIREFLENKYDSPAAMQAALLGIPISSQWRVRDFDYIAETDFAVKLLKNAGKKKGFNILLYGEPGTGKTSFAQMLAACTKRNLYPIGENGAEERVPNYRLHQLHQKLDLLEKDPKGCLLFDEAEDLFSSPRTKCDKVEINRLLENNTSPVIWTTNNIRLMDPAFVRRFTLAVYFERPPVSVRQQIWKKQLQAHQLPHTFRETLALAKEFPVAPSLIAGAVHAAQMVKGDLNTVRQHIHIMTQALRGGRKTTQENQKTENFNPLLIHADMDLACLTSQLKGLGRMNFSLCLYGASGTGKSAYARYLAEELNLEVQQRRASDLISPFVGETEHNIARAFAQAREEHALLVFDEADSFLQDRSRAHHSWEISGVNEMLTWMEKHPYPFICTTNLMDTLDPACLRRFSFKVKYDFLTHEQVQSAFKHFFDWEILPQEAVPFTRLTPGDFAVVKSKAEILGMQQNRVEIIKLLAAEQAVKNRLVRPQIGFCK